MKKKYQNECIPQGYHYLPGTSSQYTIAAIPITKNYNNDTFTWLQPAINLCWFPPTIFLIVTAYLSNVKKIILLHSFLLKSVKHFHTFIHSSPVEQFPYNKAGISPLLHIHIRIGSKNIYVFLDPVIQRF